MVTPIDNDISAFLDALFAPPSEALQYGAVHGHHMLLSSQVEAILAGHATRLDVKTAMLCIQLERLDTSKGNVHPVTKAASLSKEEIPTQDESLRLLLTPAFKSLSIDNNTQQSATDVLISVLEKEVFHLLPVHIVQKIAAEAMKELLQEYKTLNAHALHEQFEIRLRQSLRTEKVLE